jgi:hypothetical protein
MEILDEGEYKYRIGRIEYLEKTIAHYEDILGRLEGELEYTMEAIKIWQEAHYD